MIRRIVFLALVLAPLASLAAEGPGLRDVMQARSYAMGGAYRAIGGGTEAVDGNPASIGLHKRYLVELSGAWDPRNPFGFGSLGVLDGVTSPVAAGLTYRLVSLGTGATQRTAHINTAGFSIPFGQAFHIGVSTRHILMTGAQTANAITGDAGMLLNLGGFVLSVAGHNLIDIQNPEFQRYFSASTGFVTQSFSVAADVRADFNEPDARFSWGAGGEWIIGGAVPVRAGYSRDGITQAQRLSGGLGLIIGGGGFDLSYSHELGGAKSRLLALTLRMQTQ
ncbi:MAG: hypothetical protein WBV82_07560 [Myxococcaceae bacterium]